MSTEQADIEGLVNTAKARWVETILEGVAAILGDQIPASLQPKVEPERRVVWVAFRREWFALVALEDAVRVGRPKTNRDLSYEGTVHNMDELLLRLDRLTPKAQEENDPTDSTERPVSSQGCTDRAIHLPYIIPGKFGNCELGASGGFVDLCFIRSGRPREWYSLGALEAVRIGEALSNRGRHLLLEHNDEVEAS